MSIPCGSWPLTISASFDGDGEPSTIFSSRSPGDPMIPFARSTSVTPGSWTRIWSAPCCAMLGSATPSSLTRRSIVWRAHVHDGDVARLELVAQTLHLLLGHEPKRIVGLDAEDEVDAALEIEPELELLVHQPAGRRQVVARRHDGIHPEPEEQDEDAKNGDDLPAKVRHKTLF